MKYLSLFSGIGGFEYGIENAFQYISKWSRGRERVRSVRNKPDSKMQRTKTEQEEHMPKNIGYSEIDKYARRIYERHYPGHKSLGDITKIKTEELEDFDLLVGGFPCQSFSIAGKRGGFSDTRGTLFFEIARILTDKRPKYLLLENVKGLLSHDKGETFETILEILTDIGYVLQWEVLNSKNFGVPQNRERVFIIGHLRGEHRPEVFPLAQSSEQGIRPSQSYTQEAGYKSDSINTIRRTPLTNNMRIRRLTPTECERLQGFPDGWTEGISDTQRYKCLGNAVTTNVITEIIRWYKL